MKILKQIINIIKILKNNRCYANIKTKIKALKY